MMKTLMVVSGGDAPGINTLIARYTMLAQAQGDSVVGAMGGFEAVLSGQFRPIDLSMVRRMEGIGGSYLPSSRVPVLAEENARAQLRQTLQDNEIDNVVLFGGDGTLRYVLPLLLEWQIPVAAIPTTIDNDVAGTERTLGFDSACNFAYQTIEGILATAHALPGRLFLLETLGGDTGYLALEIAYAAGVHAVLVPEYDFGMNWLADRLKRAVTRDSFALAVVTEGVKTLPDLLEDIPRLTDTRLRFSRLGHAQRGGQVSHLDRKLATEMAHLAYEAFKAGQPGGALMVRQNQLLIVNELVTVAHKAPPDKALYNHVNGLIDH
ncbi:MAG: 6-phosphofructokinase [Anaerolineae bacterium]|nr:6-phosphofructokinase [Anaerolineae bacterium]